MIEAGATAENQVSFALCERLTDLPVSLFAASAKETGMCLFSN